MKQQEITDALRRAFEANEADFSSIEDQVRTRHATARERLTRSGWNDQGDFHCLACPCPHFLQGGHEGRCRRGSCGHSLLSHDLPR
ncbi:MULTISPECIES: hypothetical protein [Streptomyces]|uniref:hypothetical protein n=1 Tax=Streptomyces TaxID=1883 RepID=UPI000F735B7E|nr:hypothetical protein [Streptomyces sp. WAC00469]RSS05277.1 hypothetical protein EF917_09735 [Streptomyces sp. WAC00469]